MKFNISDITHHINIISINFPNITFTDNNFLVCSTLKQSIHRSINRQRLVAHSTAMESIQAESEPIDEEDDVP